MIFMLMKIAKILFIIFCIYTFYKGIRERNKIKIIIPPIILLALLNIAIQRQTHGFANIFWILQMLFYIFVWILIITLPYIVGVVTSFIAIWVIKKKIASKKQEIFCIIAVIICSIAISSVAPSYYKYASAVPNESYVKMKEISDNKSLIGLSKEQVVEMIGERTK